MNRFIIACATLILLALPGSTVYAIGPNSIPNYHMTADLPGTLSEFLIIVDNDTVGATTVYRVKFILEGDSLSAGASIELDLPPYFDLNEIDSMSISNSDGDSSQFSIVEYEINALHISVQLDSIANLPEPGTQFTIMAYGLVNAPTVGSYELLIAVMRADGQLIALPRLSESFTLKPGPISQFSISPKGIQQPRAGTAVTFSYSLRDQYDNTVSGGPVTWGIIGVPAQAGIMEGSNFLAQSVGASRVFATYGAFADTSGLIYVLPGSFAYFEFTGGADSAVAGQAWRDGDEDVLVSAHDLYGNVQYEFDEEIYFESTDPTATLPHSAASPFAFSAVDQGVKVFPGSSFRFNRAGRHELRLMRDGAIEKSLFPIAIRAASPASYSLTIPTAAIAGTDIQISITNAVDQFGNAVSGQAVVTLTSGNGVSPSGVLPSLPSFAVVNGSGSGMIRLVQSGSTAIRVSFAGVIANRNVSVAPAPIARFSFEMDPTQPINQPFVGTARVTALDAYDNVAVGFNAFTDTLTITCSGSGQMYNHVIGAGNGFIEGICDLTRFGTRYDGLESFVRFTARSKSGVIGTTPPIGLSLLKITRGEFEQESRYIGEQFSFLLTIANFGTQPATVDDIRIYADGVKLQSVQISPPLDRQIPALTNEVFTITGPVPNLPNQTITIDAAFAARLGSGIVRDSVSGLDELTILAAEGVSVVPSLLLPAQVTSGREYQFSVAVRNDSDDELRLTQATTLTIPPDGSGPVVLQLPATVVVEANGGITDLAFPTVTLPGVAPQTVSDISIRLVGNLGTVAFDQSLPVKDELQIQSPPAMSAAAGSLSPAVLYRGTDVAFTVKIVNSGTATLATDVLASALTMFADERQLDAKLDATILDIFPGNSPLQFKPITIPDDISAEIDSFVVVVRGTANGHSEVSRFKIAGSEVAIPFGAALKLVDVSLEMLNPPYVNLGQSFKVEATMRNTGDEPLKEILVRLTSNGASTFVAEQVIASLSVGEDSTIEYAVEAAFQSTISELFSVAIIEATGATSGLAALVESPQGNPTEVVVIQTPASLNLESLISAPASAQDGILGLGETFTIAVSVLNSGQSGAGAGELTVSVIEGGFTISGTSTKSFTVGQQVDWDIIAPADDDTGKVVVTISLTPEDLNIESAARVLDRADTIQVISSESQVAMGLDFVAAPLQLLTPGNTYDILDLTFDIVGEAEQPYLNFVEFEIHDRQGNIVAPSVVVSSARLSFNNQFNLDGAIVDNAMRFELGEEFGVPRSATISLTVASAPALVDFSFYLDSNSVAASYETAAGTKPVPISARFASTLMIEQEFTLVAIDLTSSFFSYPNPFSPLHERATIVYNLDSPKAATLKVYTLSGEEVLSREIPAPESLSEPVRIEWDGRNNDGRIVLNGVYLAVLTVPGEGEVRTKIAVVK